MSPIRAELWFFKSTLSFLFSAFLFCLVWITHTSSCLWRWTVDRLCKGLSQTWQPFNCILMEFYYSSETMNYERQNIKCIDKASCVYRATLATDKLMSWIQFIVSVILSWNPLWLQISPKVNWESHILKDIDIFEQFLCEQVTSLKRLSFLLPRSFTIQCI